MTDTVAAIEAASPFRRLAAWIVAAPAYPAEGRDLRSVNVLGVELPARASLAIVLVSMLLLLDYHGTFLPLLGAGGAAAPDEARLRAVSRALLLGGVPLLVVLLLRDRPSRYGLGLGDWRAGLAIGLAGIGVMFPIVVAFAQLPDARAWYGPYAAAPLDVVLTTAIEVIPAEFFFRGFLLFALLRVIGPIALLVATLPFAFAHLGKPQVETLSTLVGGFAYGWLDWRTGSILWSGLAHTAILSLAVFLVAAAGPA